MPTGETGFAGSAADLARPMWNASVLWNSAWISASSSGNTKPAPGVPSPSSGVYAIAPALLSE